MRVEEQCQEDTYFLIGDFVDAIDDESHLVPVGKVSFKLQPVAAAISFLKAVLVSHALFEHV
jgi:hypothetical protein